MQKIENSLGEIALEVQQQSKTVEVMETETGDILEREREVMLMNRVDMITNQKDGGHLRQQRRSIQEWYRQDIQRIKVNKHKIQLLGQTGGNQRSRVVQENTAIKRKEKQVVVQLERYINYNYVLAEADHVFSLGRLALELHRTLETQVGVALMEVTKMQLEE